MPIADLLIYLFLLLGVVVSIITKKLTIAGAVTGGVVGLFIYKGAGYAGIAMLALFFIAGSWATGWQPVVKQGFGSAEAGKGRRTAGQVLANGGMAGLLGAVAWYQPVYAPLCRLMMAGSLASAMADTLSSELGMVYGRRFYNIISLKKDERGLDGVISLEGTLIGAIGAVVIALAYALGFGWKFETLLIMAGGIIGNITDSVLGATLERRRLIGNNVVNFLNTLTGAFICGILSLFIK